MVVVEVGWLGLAAPAMLGFGLKLARKTLPRRWRIVSPKKPIKPERTDRTRINEEIRAAEIRVIDPEGRQLGILTPRRALETAIEMGLDLVEISPSANPPVCKIMDDGRFKYEQTKKKQEAKKKQTTIQIKEIKVRPKTSDHDLQTKIGHIKKFIGHKDKVKVTVLFRGREITLHQQAREVLQKITAETADMAVVEQEARFEGRTMVMLMAPK